MISLTIFIIGSIFVAFYYFLWRYFIEKSVEYLKSCNITIEVNGDYEEVPKSYNTFENGDEDRNPVNGGRL